jgi:hypothetical protein
MHLSREALRLRRSRAAPEATDGPERGHGERQRSRGITRSDVTKDLCRLATCCRSERIPSLMVLLYTNSARFRVKARFYVGAPFYRRRSTSIPAGKPRYGIDGDAVRCVERENQNKSIHCVAPFTPSDFPSINMPQIVVARNQAASGHCGQVRVSKRLPQSSRPPKPQCPAATMWGRVGAQSAEVVRRSVARALRCARRGTR